MPLELYELIKKFTAIRLIVFLINAAVVLFLIYRVGQKEEPEAENFVAQRSTLDATGGINQRAVDVEYESEHGG